MRAVGDFVIGRCVLRNFALGFVVRVWFLAFTSGFRLRGYFVGCALWVSVVLLCVCCYVWVLCLRLLSGVKFGLCGLLLFLWVGLTRWCGVVDYVIALITRGFCWFVMFDVDCAGCLVG